MGCQGSKTLDSKPRIFWTKRYSGVSHLSYNGNAAWACHSLSTTWCSLRYISLWTSYLESVLQFSLLPFRRETVGRFEAVRRWVRPDDLLSLPLPRWMIDAINPILRLHDNTAVFRHCSWMRCVVEEPLRTLEGQASCFHQVKTGRTKKVRYHRARLLPSGALHE